MILLNNNPLFNVGTPMIRRWSVSSISTSTANILTNNNYLFISITNIVYSNDRTSNV